jgi:16S rRNA (uracil1498-N3)-methyltransferase
MRQFPRVYFEGALSVGDQFSLEGDEAHHLIHVLRIKEGEIASVFTDQGNEFLAHVEKVESNSLKLSIHEAKSSFEKSYKVVLVQAIPKSQKMDWIIEKATELGVDEIYPVITHLVVKKTTRIERWQKIALAASKQSQRLSVPRIHPVLAWKDFLQTLKSFDLPLMASLSSLTRQTLDQAVQKAAKINSVALAIGPEGDFAPHEVKEAVRLGWVLIDLGPLTLRTETAAVVGLAVLDHELRKRFTCT